MYTIIHVDIGRGVEEGEVGVKFEPYLMQITCDPRIHSNAMLITCT